MSSTPLLSAAGGLPGPHVMLDHPAFLRVSHSPWQCIPQNVLVALRGLTLAYLVAVGAMIGHYKSTEESEGSPWRHFFDFGLISYALVSFYHLITFGGVESWIIRAMSLPANMGSLRKQFYFTLFYATATVFAFMNSSIYWFVTRQHETAALLVAAATATATATAKGASPSPVLLVVDGPFSILFGEGWFKPFIICNLYGVTAAIMILETIFLNSTKRPAALGSHFLGLMVHSGLYLAWAALGKVWTDIFPFFWLDEKEVGSKEAVTAYCIGFVLAWAPSVYTLALGFVGIREGVTRSLAERASSLEDMED